ncbi:survival motor neuron protein-like [Topomyia yanbarensis]|uniref:survival motor neuron protein-like n=1 Tax=Topomyia yanbarensis TaxID=2498891 RepID=UPI00273AB0C3|nr:survival motor neuron protein-like [Topomyia yanbarensis]
MNLGRVKPSSSSSESEHSNDEIWDDTLIIRKYDESLTMVREEVAKRLAMKTNKKVTSKVQNGQPEQTTSEEVKPGLPDQPPADEGTATEKGSVEMGSKPVFKIGDYCRATYDDGVDYEAKILAMSKDGSTLLRYVGYNNDQTVAADSLVPSWGRKARRKQREDAAELAFEEDHQRMEVSDDEEKLTKKASNIRINYSPSFRMPMAGSAASGAAGYGAGMGMGASFVVPPPPPMPPMLDNDDDVESENLSAMLMSWYMSGYYTGLYHGQKMSQKRARPT